MVLLTGGIDVRFRADSVETRGRGSKDEIHKRHQTLTKTGHENYCGRVGLWVMSGRSVTVHDSGTDAGLKQTLSSQA